MVKYVLHYFDIRGLAETARLLFHYGNIDFEDHRVTQETWPEVKPNSPTGKLPWLDIDDEQLPESGAIFRYLAKKVGLYGKDDLEAAKIDSMAGIYQDFGKELQSFFYVAIGFKEGDKQKLYDEEYLPAAEKAFAYIEKTLEKSGSGFVVPSGPSWIDFLMSESILSLRNVTDLEQRFPKIVEYQERVHNLPQIREYIKNRKPSPY